MITTFFYVMEKNRNNDINSRLFSHLLGDKTKLVLEAYIDFEREDISRMHAEEAKSTYHPSNDRQVPHLQRDGEVLYVKRRRETLHFFHRFFVTTAETFVTIRSALRKYCCFLLRPKGRRRQRESSDTLRSASSRCTSDISEADHRFRYGSRNLNSRIFRKPNAYHGIFPYDTDEKSYEDGKQSKNLIIDFSTLDGPDQLDQAAWIHFRIQTTRKLVMNLKFNPYVRLREGFFCMSAEVLRSVNNEGLSDDMLMKLTIFDEELDTAETVLGLLCNDILLDRNETVRIRCFMAEPGSDLLAIECKKLKPNDHEQLRCRCEGSKLRKVTSGKDFAVWEPQSTARLCSQCKFKSVPKGYDEFHKHLNELLSTASPSIHEKDKAESDFLLKNPDDEDEQTNNDLDDDIRMLQAVLSKISAVSDVLTLSVTRANISILLLLLVLFLPIIVIVSITSVREHAEIIAAGVAFIPTMLATLAALVSIAPTKISERWGKLLLYKKVETFKELKSLLGLHKYSNQQWREALLNMDHGSFNTYPFGSVYNRHQDSKYLSLSEWCQMSLGELQNCKNPIRVILNKMKRTLIVDSIYPKRIRPIVPRGDFLSVQSEAKLSNTKLEDLAHCDEHKNSIFKEDVNSD